MHDFYSDTKTKPTRAMREAMLDVAVGDEQKGEDPTTAALCERVADLLGKEAALFLPSGTMCNEIALGVHCRPGDEVICERTSHIIFAEGGAPAMLWGVMLNPIDGEHGTFTPDQVTASIRTPSRYSPRSRLLSVEQTANLGGGAIWPADALTSVAETARAAGLATHLDGARLMNAVVASEVAADRMVAGFDSCWIDFTKGLGAPVGAAMAGSREFIEAAWFLKQKLGGAMRQSGVLAAMCLHALDHHVERLAEDHALAKSIGERISAMPGVIEMLPVQTNIIIFDLAPDVPDAAALTRLLADDGIIVGVFGPRRIRVVTHLDVDGQAGDALCDRLASHLSAAVG